jgi:hypothetical protein
MTTDLMRGASTYTGEKKLAFGHCSASGYEGGGSGLTKKIPGG